MKTILWTSPGLLGVLDGTMWIGWYLMAPNSTATLMSLLDWLSTSPFFLPPCDGETTLIIYMVNNISDTIKWITVLSFVKMVNSGRDGEYMILKESIKLQACKIFCKKDLSPLLLSNSISWVVIILDLLLSLNNTNNSLYYWQLSWYTYLAYIFNVWQWL